MTFRTSKAFREGERVERRRVSPDYEGQGIHERGTIIALEISSAGERAARIRFDSGYEQLTLTRDIRRIQ